MVKGGAAPTLVSVYPNPSQDGNVTVAFANTEPKDIVVCDISGKIIRKAGEVVANRYTLSGLQGGIYILKVIDNTNNQSRITKILVTK